METQEKSRQKMQKDRLHWTVSQKRCESHTKQARCEERQLSCRRWACGGRNTILLVDSVLFRLEKNDGSCFWLCSLNEIGLEEPNEGYKSVAVGGKFCESSKLLLCLQRLGGGGIFLLGPKKLLYYYSLSARCMVLQLLQRIRCHLVGSKDVTC